MNFDSLAHIKKKIFSKKKIGLFLEIKLFILRQKQKLNNSRLSVRFQFSQIHFETVSKNFILTSLIPKEFKLKKSRTII